MRIGRLIISTCFLLSVPCVYGQKFKNIYDDFLLKNIDLIREKSAIETSYQNIISKKGEKAWSLSASASYSNDEADVAPSTSSFMPFSTKYNGQSLSLNKVSQWGGTFSLSNDFGTTKASSTFSGTTDAKEFKQSVSYSQDLGANFFGKKYRLDLEKTVQAHELQKNVYSYSKEMKLTELTRYYANAILAAAKVELAKQALQRAVKRENLIRKRLKDGLSEKVDYLQAQMSRQGTNEAFLQTQISFNNELLKLGNFIDRKVQASDISDYTKLESIDFSHSAYQKKLNALIEVKKKELELTDKNVLSMERSNIPTIALSTTYTTNKYADSLSDAFSDGLLGGENAETAVALSLTWNFDDRLNESSIAKARLDKELKLKELNNSKRSLSLQEEKLVKEDEYITNSIKSVKKRIELAKELLNQNNRRYNLGRTDLDTVIRSEEELINAQRAFYEMIILRIFVNNSLAQLRGYLKEYVLNLKF